MQLKARAVGDAAIAESDRLWFEIRILSAQLRATMRPTKAVPAAVCLGGDETNVKTRPEWGNVEWHVNRQSKMFIWREVNSRVEQTGKIFAWSRRFSTCLYLVLIVLPARMHVSGRGHSVLPLAPIHHRSVFGQRVPTPRHCESQQ